MPRARGDQSVRLLASPLCRENGSAGTLAALFDPSPKPARSRVALVRVQPQEAGPLPTQLSLSTPSCSAATPARAQEVGRPAAMSVCSATASARSPPTRVRPPPMQIFRSLPALLSSAHNRPTPTQPHVAINRGLFLGDICLHIFHRRDSKTHTQTPSKRYLFVAAGKEVPREPRDSTSAIALPQS